LVEAAALSAGVGTAPVTASRPGRVGATHLLLDAALGEAVGDLHAARGTVPLPDPSSRRSVPWRRAAVASGIDLLDVHERSARVHARSLDRIDHALDSVVALLVARLPR
jgi:hypothetical protein